MTTRIILALCCVGLSLQAAPQKSSIQVIEPNPRTGAARAVIVNPEAMVYTTQILPIDPKGQVINAGEATAHVAATFNLLGMALRTGGSDLRHLVKINVYAADNDMVTVAQNFFASASKQISPPAITYVVGRLSNPNVRVAMDAVAVSSRLPAEAAVHRERSKQLKGNEGCADVAMLPLGGVIYISGQAQKGVIAEAAGKTLAQLGETLKFLKLEKSDVVSAKAFLQPSTNAAIVRAEFGKFFQGELVPPLSIVDWTSGKELPIEIELVVAARGTVADSHEPVSHLCPPDMTPSPVYSKITRVNSGKLIYLSGIVGKTSNNAEAEVHEIFSDLKEVLQKAGSDLDHLAKATYYVSTSEGSAKLNEIRPKYYNPKTPPAASKAMVKSVGFPEKSVSFDMIAVSTE